MGGFTSLGFSASTPGAELGAPAIVGTTGRVGTAGPVAAAKPVGEAALGGGDVDSVLPTKVPGSLDERRTEAGKWPAQVVQLA